MRPRSLLTTAVATAALTLRTARRTQAACHRTTELVDRFAFDATVEQTAGSFHMANATNGALGGFLDLTVTAKDGSLPVGANVCEPAVVDAVLTVSPRRATCAQTQRATCGSPVSGRRTHDKDGHDPRRQNVH